MRCEEHHLVGFDREDARYVVQFNVALRGLRRNDRARMPIDHHIGRDGHDNCTRPIRCGDAPRPRRGCTLFGSSEPFSALVDLRWANSHSGKLRNPIVLYLPELPPRSTWGNVVLGVIPKEVARDQRPHVIC